MELGPVIGAYQSASGMSTLEVYGATVTKVQAKSVPLVLAMKFSDDEPEDLLNFLRNAITETEKSQYSQKEHFLKHLEGVLNTVSHRLMIALERNKARGNRTPNKKELLKFLNRFNDSINRGINYYFYITLIDIHYCSYY